MLSRPHSDGFFAVIGGSAAIAQMVDTTLFERLACGGGVPVDISATRRSVVHQGWVEDKDTDCIDGFDGDEFAPSAGSRTLGASSPSS